MSFSRRNLAALAFSGALVVSAIAAPQKYASTVQTIRAGVVMLSQSTSSNVTNLPPGNPYASSTGQSIAPYAFYNLDLATGVKPAGWNIVNPNAPGSVSSSIQTDWLSEPQLLDPISKQNEEYWAVYLNQISDTQLSNYDVLLLNPINADLTSVERQRLTKFVDQGGILWVDTAGMVLDGGNIDATNGFVDAFGVASGSGTVSALPFAQLLNNPYVLSGNDLDAISGPGVLSTYYGIFPDSGTIYPDSVGFNRYQPITAFGNTPMISVAHEGDGYIVATTMGASVLLGGGTANIGYNANAPFLSQGLLSAAKLAVNMISLRQDFAQSGGGARNTGSSPIDVTAPVLARWSDDSGSNGSGYTPTAAPVTYKGLELVSVTDGSGGYYVAAYDANPANDLDGDGDSDDGIFDPMTGNINNNLRDFSAGKSYDLVWISPKLTGGPISSPVCAQVPEAAVTDQVLVVDGTGKLHAFNAFPRNANGYLLHQTAEIANYPLDPKPAVAAPFAINSTAVLAAPNSPTISGDLAFMTYCTGDVSGNGPTGVVWVADLATGTIPQSVGTEPWELGLTTANPSPGGNNLPGFTASPTVGYIPIADNLGGYDKVVYAPGVFGINNSPGFSSIWFGVKGESPPPTSVTVTGSSLQVTTRAASSGLFVYTSDQNPTGTAQQSLLPRITITDATGKPVSGAVTGQPTQTSGAGQLDYTLTGVGANVLTSGGTVTIDYTIDWGRNANNNISAVRGGVTFPTASGITTQRVLGPIALTAAGTVVMTVSDPGKSIDDGSLWWLNESTGRGVFSVTGRWSLYSAYNMPTTPAPIPENAVFEDTDPIQNLIAGTTPSITSPMTKWYWTGAPVVSGNQVFATATAAKGVISDTVVMAFAADPSPPKFSVANQPALFNMVQPDFDRSDEGSRTALTGPSVSSNLSSSDASGAVTIDGTSGYLTLNSLAPIQGAGGVTTIGDCLNLSEPLLIQSGEVSSLLEPETVGGNWSPLHWYCVYDGTTAIQRPLVTGNTVFFSGTSIVPKLLTGGTFSPSAVINAMDATISSNDPFTGTASDRSWEPQVYLLEGSGTSISPDPHIKMPSSVGLTSFADYQTRLIQQTLGTSTTCYGLSGGGSNLIGWGDKGVYGLSRADFSICDNGRYIRTDSNGDPLFSSNATLNTGPGGGSPLGDVKPLVRPTRAYPLANDQTLVVDAGANRVIKTDSTGAELRALDHFIPDSTFRPSGYVAGEPRTFSNPQDAVTYSNYVSAANNPFLGSGATGAEEYWVHYVIADTGNHRLVELVDRYSIVNGNIGPIVTKTEADPNAKPTSTGDSIPQTSVPQIGVLFWQSPSSVSGGNFAYDSLVRVLYFNSSTNTDQAVYVAGIGNTQPQLAAQGLDSSANLSLGQNSTGNGGVVIIDPAYTPGSDSLIPSGVVVFNSFDKPDLSTTNEFYGTDGRFDNPGPAGMNMAAISNIRSVSVRTAITLIGGLPKTMLNMMITESSGVYEFQIDPNPTVAPITTPPAPGDLGSPIWYFNSTEYASLRGGANAANPSQLIPAYAKRLDSGDVLLVNSYVGTTFGSQPFSGEVLVLNGGSVNSTSNNLGFTPVSIHFSLAQGGEGANPGTTITGFRGLVAPIFADRK